MEDRADKLENSQEDGDPELVEPKTSSAGKGSKAKKGGSKKGGGGAKKGGEKKPEKGKGDGKKIEGEKDGEKGSSKKEEEGGKKPSKGNSGKKTSTKTKGKKAGTKKVEKEEPITGSSELEEAAKKMKELEARLEDMVSVGEELAREKEALDEERRRASLLESRVKELEGVEARASDMETRMGELESFIAQIREEQSYSSEKKETISPPPSEPISHLAPHDISPSSEMTDAPPPNAQTEKGPPAPMDEKMEKPPTGTSPREPQISREEAAIDMTAPMQSPPHDEGAGQEADVMASSTTQSMEHISTQEDLLESIPSLLSDMVDVNSRMGALERSIVNVARAPSAMDIESLREELLNTMGKTRASEHARTLGRTGISRDSEKEMKKIEEKLSDLMDEVGFGESLDVSKIPPNILEVVYQTTLNDIFLAMRKTLGDYDAENALSKILDDVRLKTSGSELFYFDGRIVQTRNIAKAIEKKLVSAKQMHTTYSVLLESFLDTIPSHKAKNFRAMIKLKSQEYAIDAATRHSHRIIELSEQLDNSIRNSSSLSAALNSKHKDMEDAIESQEQNLLAMIKEQGAKTDALFQSIPETYSTMPTLEEANKHLEEMERRMKSLSSDVGKVLASIGLKDIGDKEQEEGSSEEKVEPAVPEQDIEVLKEPKKEKQAKAPEKKIMPLLPGTIEIGDDDEAMDFLTNVYHGDIPKKSKKEATEGDEALSMLEALALPKKSEKGKKSMKKAVEKAETIEEKAEKKAPKKKSGKKVSSEEGKLEEKKTEKKGGKKKSGKAKKTEKVEETIKEKAEKKADTIKEAVEEKKTEKKGGKAEGKGKKTKKVEETIKETVEKKAPKKKGGKKATSGKGKLEEKKAENAGKKEESKKKAAVSDEDKMAVLALLEEEKSLAKLKKESPLKYTVLLDALKALIDEERIAIETRGRTAVYRRTKDKKK